MIIQHVVIITLGLFCVAVLWLILSLLFRQRQAKVANQERIEQLQNMLLLQKQNRMDSIKRIAQAILVSGDRNFGVRDSTDAY